MVLAVVGSPRADAAMHAIHVVNDLHVRIDEPAPGFDVFIGVLFNSMTALKRFCNSERIAAVSDFSTAVIELPSSA